MIALFGEALGFGETCLNTRPRRPRRSIGIWPQLTSILRSVTTISIQCVVQSCLCWERFNPVRIENPPCSGDPNPGAFSFNEAACATLNAGAIPQGWHIKRALYLARHNNAGPFQACFN